MLKDLIKTLAGWDWFYSNSVRDAGFGYSLEDVKIHTWYALRFEINRNKFKDYFCDNVNFDLFKSDLKPDVNPVNLCHDYLNSVGQGWYEFYLDNKSLVDKTSSLKSDSKKWYKNNINKDLKNFDRFMEAVLKLYNEAFNVYEIIFYSPDAIHKNITFIQDRGSCYINSRKDYYTVISQLPSFYILIYKNQKAITRLWAVLSNDLNHIAIFNRYGYEFKTLEKFFGLPEEFKKVLPDSLEKRLGIYVNDEEWFLDKDAILDKFIYKVNCPVCGCQTFTDELEWINDRLHCPECLHSGEVWSEYNNCYIDEEEACYSEIYEDYFYSDQVVYSDYHDTYILKRDAVCVYNYDIGSIDYVLEENAVYSSYSDEWLIEDQAVYSNYYDTYLLKTDDVVYSRWLDSYIDREDDDIIQIDDDYIPLEDLKEYIERNNIKQLKTV